MNWKNALFILIASFCILGCTGTVADEAITLGDEKPQPKVWDNQKGKGPIVVSDVDTNEMFVLTDERGVFLVKERYNIQGDHDEQVWVVEKVFDEDTASAI